MRDEAREIGSQRSVNVPRETKSMIRSKPWQARQIHRVLRQRSVGLPFAWREKSIASAVEFEPAPANGTAGGKV
jgi:hypothetical protein